MSAPSVKPSRQHLRLSVNSALIDKIAPTDKKSWSHGFETHELTIEELAKTVCELGYAFSYVFEGGVRKTENFLGADFLAVDVDGAQTIEHALKNRWVSKYCSLLYTVSDRPGALLTGRNGNQSNRSTPEAGTVMVTNLNVATT